MRIFGFRLIRTWCLLLAVPALAQEADPLVGLWGEQLDFGPKLRGELVVKRDGNNWSATLAGQQASFTVARDQIRFTFGGGDGFRGRLAGKSIEGFWMQPTGETQDS